MHLPNLKQLKKALRVSWSLVLMASPLGASTVQEESEMSDASFSYLLDLARDEHQYRHPTAIGREALWNIALTLGHANRFGAAYFLYSIENRKKKDTLRGIDFGEGKENWIDDVVDVLNIIKSSRDYGGSSDPQKLRTFGSLDIISIMLWSDTGEHFLESLDQNIPHFQELAQCILKNDSERLNQIAQDNTHILQFEAAYELHSKGNPQSGSLALQSIASDHAHSRQWDALVALWKSAIEENESFAHKIFKVIALDPFHPLHVPVTVFFLKSSVPTDQLLGLEALRLIVSTSGISLNKNELRLIGHSCNLLTDLENIKAVKAIFTEIAKNNDHPLQMVAVKFLYSHAPEGDPEQAFSLSILEAIASKDTHPMQREVAEDFFILPQYNRKDLGWRTLQSIVENDEHSLQLETSIELLATSNAAAEKLGYIGCKHVIANVKRTLLEKAQAALQLLLSLDEGDQLIGKKALHEAARPDMTLLSLLAHDDGDAPDEWKAIEKAAILLKDCRDPIDQAIAKKTLTTLARYKARKAGLDEDFIQSKMGS